MREPKLGYTAHSCRSTLGSRILGSTVKSWLESQSFPRGSAALFIRRSLALPGCSLRTYEALKELSIGEFKCEDLKLVFAKPTAVAWIPNLWLLEEYQDSAQTFRRLPSFKKVSCGTVFGPDCPFAYLSLAALFQALEAIALDSPSPVIVAYLGGRFQFASPEFIDLKARKIKRFRKKNTNHEIYDPEVYALSLQYRQLAAIEDPDERKALYENLRRESKALAPKLDNFASKALKEILDLGERPPSTPPQTVVRYSTAIMEALSTVRQGIVQEASGPKALFLRRITGLESEAPKFSRALSATSFALSQPGLIFENYGLDVAMDRISSLRDSALRVAWVIMAYCGRRASCLLHLTLGDFLSIIDLMSNRELVELRLRYAKTRQARRGRLKLHLLLPAEELRHLAEFLKKAATEYPETWRDLTLVELFAGRKFSSNEVSKIVAVLLDNLPQGSVRLGHLPRITFATWLPLRILVARDRRLLAHPAVDAVRNHPWFSTEMLNKLLELIGNDTVDALEIVRRVLGHTSSYEFLASYCLGWSMAVRLLVRV
jgi:hypothetical protein